MAQGLREGVPLTLQVSRGGEVETLVATLEEVGEECLAVSTPMRKLAYRLLPPGMPVQAAYLDGGRRFRFETEVRGTDPGGRGQYLALPRTIETSDRRRSYRLRVMLTPASVYRLKVDPERDEREGRSLRCTIVDLSEGGLCLSTATTTERGEWLGLVLDLQGAGQLKARMRVVQVDEGGDRRRQRAHCEFAGISRWDRDLIARYLVRLQLEMRREGRL